MRYARKWLEDPVKRSGLVSVVSCGLAFLIPVTGWNPLLLLWTANFCFAYKENLHRTVRFFYGAAALLLLAMAAFNLTMRFFAV